MNPVAWIVVCLLSFTCTLHGATQLEAPKGIQNTQSTRNPYSPLATTKPLGDMKLWYRQPASKWLEAMPIGNGLMGAMIFGGTHAERIALNESSFWSGRPHDYN